MNIQIRKIQHGSSEFDLEVQLRSQILREPLGMKFSKDELDQEKGSLHLGAFDDSQLLGCLVLVPLEDGKMKMRQVAIAAGAQGLGVGRGLVEYSEQLSAKMGCHEIVLNARATATPFYLKLGYEIFGEPFEEVTLPHRQMRKRL